MNQVKVGVLGCGVVAERVYLPGISQILNAALVAVCDQVEERARKAAATYSIPQVYSDLDDMLAESDIDLMVNLTPIQAHYATNLSALRAGVHVYSEKTFTTTVDQATHLIQEAEARDLRLGAAAATMLSPVSVKIAELLRAGAIGTVSFCVAHQSHGGPAAMEGWSTDPTWFYKQGAGPLLDMGVYALHTVTGLLGPVRSVYSQSGISVPKRTVRSGPAQGKVIDVEVDDNTLLLLDFGEATFAFVHATYCVQARRGPRLEIYGSEGTILVNDRTAQHPLSVYRDDAELDLRGWMDLELPLARPWTLTSGVEHLVECILDRNKRVITSGEHARHVIEIMNKGSESARTRSAMELETQF
jgi:predicted dehydrogenase